MIKVTTKCCEWLLAPEHMGDNADASLKERVLGSKAFRAFLVFSAFRAVYGAGILVVTYLLATSEEAPVWTSIAFLLTSMVVSRVIFRYIKRKWPSLFS
tara:strand:- start:162 stop:458 length:297 start_codon:yes stop_codon:yes gene_type:complete